MTAKQQFRLIKTGCLQCAVFLVLGLPVRAGTPWEPAQPFRPPLRDEVSLRAFTAWTFTTREGVVTNIAVPELWDAAPGFTTDQGTYERNLQVPGSWTNKRVSLEFEGVSQMAEIYVNGTQVVSQVGGWIPFAVDLTDRVQPGQYFSLKVIVKGGNQQPVVDAGGNPLWPVGWYAHQVKDANGNGGRWGIVHPVWLRAYGQIHIADAFIRTSVSSNSIAVDYTLRNADAISHTVVIEADAAQESTTNITEKSLAGNALTLAPGQTTNITLSASWTNAALYWPTDPRLYVLKSRLKEGGVTIDAETRRFGFREVTVSGTQLRFNGVRLNLVGDSCLWQSQLACNNGRYQMMMPSNWTNTVDRLRSLNIRVLRFHMEPPPNWVLDVCDQKGMLVIGEAAVYARDYIKNMPAGNKATYLANAKTWIGAWIRSQRHHPSIIRWNAENEMGVGWLNWMTNAELLSLGNEIRKYDTTRPVGYDGDRDTGDAMVDYHYPEGYLNQPSGSLYSWGGIRSATKPTGVGEFITSYDVNADRNQWWQGTWTRGLRYLDFADIRPYSLGWAWYANANSNKVLNLRNSFNPVALFDKDYDDLGINPIVTNGTPPSVDEGSIRSGTLLLYNDEFKGTNIWVDVTLKVTGTVFATSTMPYSVDPGAHRAIPYSFQVPNQGGQYLDLVLATRKDQVQRFEETKRFAITEKGVSGTTSNQVSLPVPDDWYITYFGHTGLSDDGNEDGDGMSNRQEYLAGTNPNDSNSCLRLSGLSPDLSVPGRFIVRWASAAGRTYVIQAATNLAVGFDQTVGSGIPATPTENVGTDDVADTAQKFYRVRLDW